MLMAASIVTAISVLWLLMTSPVASIAPDQTFTVRPGWGGGRIAQELEKAGLVRWTISVLLIANLTDTGNQLKAGTYLLSADMTPREIVRIIATGEALSSDVQVTIPEGMNSWEIDELLTKQKLIVRGSFARQAITGEGTYFPDTYRFDASVASGSRVFQDAKKYITAFRAEFERKASAYSQEHIIIASMLEKEAKTANDMKLVAGIIARRRQLGMPLQIDATVAYGWCLARWLPMNSNQNCDVTQAPIALEIKKDGPYNTYTRVGLPEGPIANPGLVALDAAVYPQKSDYLYYLSSRDGSQIIYSKTLQEHLANRRKYLGL